ncbi:MAG: response regulator [Candidatus Eremiobacteraeota bacterium]|nr:response regulator [Candidatus Eremiobacteraeota bacterium]
MEQLRILIIDNEENIIRSLRDILTKEGYSVESATHGTEGIGKAAEHPYDVVFLDLKLPDMSGVDVLRRLNEINGSLYVIILTGYATMDSATATIGLGAYDYILKPVEPDHVRVVVRSVLKRKDIEKRIIEKSKKPGVLFVEPCESAFGQIKDLLAGEGIQATIACSSDEAIQVLQKESWITTIVYDIDLNKTDATEFLISLKALNPAYTFIPITSKPVVKEAIRLMKEGACDYLIKPANPEDIYDVLIRAWRSQNLNFKNRQLIYELQKLYEDLEISSEYMENIIHSVNDILIVTDNEGKITMVSSATWSLLGYKEDDLKREHISRVIGGDFGDFLSVRDEMKRAGSIKNIEKSLITRYGERIPVIFSGSVIKTSYGRIYGMIFVAVDISERKKVEETLRKAKEDAELASRAKSQFLANMSHEIRTPLNAVIGFASLLKETVLDTAQVDYVNTIKKSSEVLLSLINDILDVSKIEAREIHLEHIDFNLELVVENVLKIIRPRIKSSIIEIFYVYDDEAPRFFVGDPTRIYQILFNLLSNSLKFTERGEISVRIAVEPQQPMQGEKKRAMVKVSVHDTGIGIPPDKMDRIFDLFVQVDSSTTRKYGGTGLGLAITKAFIEMMGGHIEVRSTVGEGSEFVFTLDLELSSSASIKNLAADLISFLKGHKVAVLDDYANARKVIVDLCRSFQMEVLLSSSSPHEVLGWLEMTEVLPEVVITDIMMPEMNGFEFARKVRELPALSQIRLVALSAETVIDKAAMEDFDASLAKPVLRLELARALKRVLASPLLEVALPRAEKPAQASSGLRFLIAEDNAVSRKFVTLALKKLGCAFDAVENGREVVDKLREGTYDLILMDVQMPVMSGIEATEMIRRELHSDIPIIALTASAMIEDEKRCIEAGMNDFLSKPVDIEKLRAMMEKWLKMISTGSS